MDPNEFIELSAKDRDETTSSTCICIYTILLTFPPWGKAKTTFAKDRAVFPSGSGTFNHLFSCSSFHKSTHCTTENLTWPCPHRTESKTKGLSQSHLNMNPKQKPVGRFPWFLKISLLLLNTWGSLSNPHHSPLTAESKNRYEVLSLLDSQNIKPLFWRVSWIFQPLETPFFLLEDTTRASWQYTNRTKGASLKNFWRLFHLEAPEVGDLAARRLDFEGGWVAYKLPFTHLNTYISCIHKYIDVNRYQ